MNQTLGPVIDIQELVVEYGAFRAVDGLSFKIHKGETLAIVGESGSGKSTTAMAIMRLLNGANLSGRVMLHWADGSSIDLLGQPETELQKIRGADIAMVFQEPMTSLNPVMTIGAQIAEAVRLHQPVSKNEAKQIALASLRRARLTDPDKKFHQYPHQLSGGMRQRVMIAMALACRPSLLIADEPTTALDVTVQAEMLGLIRELQQETGMAVAYITHDLSVVAQIADQVIVMKSGKMVESQPVRPLFENPQHDYTKGLLASVPVLGSASEIDEPVKFYKSTASAGKAAGGGPGDEKVLEIRGLCKSFVIESTAYLRRPVRALQAVNNVSFDLLRGETIAVVGESGSGKSTLARAVMQLILPDSGSVKLHGKELVGLNGPRLRPHRANIQMVFQDPYASLNPKMTIGTLIAEPIVIHNPKEGRDKAAAVRSLLESVGLPPHFAERSPQQLSGGQRQRVCIARALATEPSVIVLDEAVSALDVTVQAQIVDLLIDLQREKALSYLFISHDMGIVERISHRVAVMHMGRIVEFGGKRQVLQSPAHPYTRRLLSAVLRPDPSERRARQQLDAPPPASAIRLSHELPRSAIYNLVGENHFVLADT